MKREQVEPAFLDVPGLPHDPYARRPYHRLTTVRSTSLVAPVSQSNEPMYLGRLTPYYSTDAVALPARVRARSIDTVSCHGKRSQELQSNLNKFSINIFQVPSGRVLYGVTLDVTVLTQRRRSSIFTDMRAFIFLPSAWLDYQSLLSHYSGSSAIRLKT